jgi:hypothetical protein
MDTTERKSTAVNPIARPRGIRHVPRRLGGIALALFAVAAADLAPLGAQQQWLNSPIGDGNRPVFPFFEGWYDNGDGTYTISFGYLNRNTRQVIEIPHGDRNYIEPAELDGAQPTYFLASRNRGVFAVTIPADRRDEDIWWYLTDDQGNQYKVPGRARSAAYELDWNPRPHGSLPPLMWFESESEAGKGPAGVWEEATLTTSVGRPLELTVNVRDESVRDAQDPRFREAIPVRVVWAKHQGPAGEVTFTRHASNPAAPRPTEAGGGPASAQGGTAPPEEVNLLQARGAARVYATFPAPGEYVMRAQADNWTGPDSSSGDQCCWSNAYVRVRVGP